MSSRTLVLLRHAKAEPSSGNSDFERALTDQGVRDAGAAGQWLLAQGHEPDTVICSPARRARHTWRWVAEAVGGSPQVTYSRQVYGARYPDDLLDVIRTAPAQATVLLLVGHNPNIELLSAMLDPARGRGDGMRTTSVAVHSVDGEWADLEALSAPLTATVTARG